MMKSLVSTLTLALLILAATDAMAQRGQRNFDPTERAKQQTEQMIQDLSLSTKQAEKVGEINLKYAEKMKEARANMEEGADWSAMRETMGKLRREQSEELKGVMTTAQFEQWQKIQEERTQQRRERRGQRGEGGDGPKEKPDPENKG